MTVPTGEPASRAVLGVEKKATLCVIAEVFPDTPAQQAGLSAGDVIKQFGDTKVADHPQFTALVKAHADEEMPIVVEREGKTLELRITPRLDPKTKLVRIGVGIVPGVVNTPFWMLEREPMKQIKGDAGEIVRILRALVTPHEAKQAAGAMGGPITIFVALWASIKISIWSAVGFLRFLNINLAILNLLPIPVLDGGLIMLLLWEGITGRRVNPKFNMILLNTFLVLLISVMLLLTFMDVKRLPRMMGWDKRTASTEQTTNAAPSVPTTNLTTAAEVTNAAPAVQGTNEMPVVQATNDVSAGQPTAP